MARRLKVFSADMGFVRAVVAAPNRKAALEAWGVRDDMFARGTASEVEDADLVKEAIAAPGDVLRKPIAGASDLVKAASKGGPQTKAEAAPSAKPRVRRKPPPSRKTLDAAEASLAQQERARRTTLEALDAEQADLDARRERIRADATAAITAAKRERDKAKAAYDRALKVWGGN